MIEVELLDNKFGPMVVELEEEVEFTCLGGPSKTQLYIRYIPYKYILEFMSFRDWLRENYTVENKNGTIESVGYEIYKFLDKLLYPNCLSKGLEVTNVCGSAPRHGPASAKFGWLNWESIGVEPIGVEPIGVEPKWE